MGPVPLTYLNYIQFHFSDPGIFLIPGASALIERTGEAKSQHGAGLLTLILSSLQWGKKYITDPCS